jgi:hypothetical protein
LKKELRNDFSNRIPRDDDGLPKKEFFVKMHALIYKYKKYGHELIGDVNTSERINLLEQIEEVKEQSGEMPQKGATVLGQTGAMSEA